VTGALSGNLAANTMSKTSQKEGSQSPAAPSRWRRRLRWGLLGLGVYTLVCLAYSVIPDRVPEPVLTQLTTFEARGAALVAGVGRADISPPEEMWGRLNLFGERGPIRGVAQPIYARALALGEPGAEGRLLIVSCELTFITRQLRQAVLGRLARAGYGDVALLLVATHTHVAPGNYWEGFVGERICGRFSQAYFDHLVTGIAEAAESALQEMEPVTLAAGTQRTRLLSKHMTRVDAGTGRRAYCDARIEAMAFHRADGSLLATMVSFPAHPLALLHKSEGQVAGDYPGELSGLIEAENPGAVALFLPGALGGVRATSPGGTEGYRGQSGRFAKVAMEADMLLERIAPVLAERGRPLQEVASATAVVPLPPADPHYFPEATPYTGIRFLTGPVSWLSNRLLDALLLPDEAVFQVVRIEGTVLLAVPADLSNLTGIKLKRWVAAEHVWPLSHANGYDLGYVVDADEYDLGGVIKGGYDRLMDFGGKPAGPFTLRALFGLAEQVGVERNRTQKDLP